jgi:hypothetical protein
MMRNAVRVALCLAAVAATSCSAHIKEFTVLPHEICKGTIVVAAWKASGGRGKVATEPPLEQRAQRTYLPAETTTFVLTVKPLIGKADQKPNEVTVFSATSSDPEPDGLSFEGLTCANGFVTGTADRPFTEWDAKLSVSSVGSGDGREVAVTHESHTATLTAQTPATAEFKGTKLGGTWTVRVPLLPSEKCDGSGAKPPDVVIITAQVYCGS